MLALYGFALIHDINGLQQVPIKGVFMETVSKRPNHLLAAFAAPANAGRPSNPRPLHRVWPAQVMGATRRSGGLPAGVLAWAHSAGYIDYIVEVKVLAFRRECHSAVERG